MGAFPSVGQPAGTWGAPFLDALAQEHNNDGTHKAIPVQFNSPSAGTTSYTLVIGDAGKVVGLDGSGAATTVTVPTNASVAFAQGTMILVRQRGSGVCTIAAAGGVTLRSRGSLFSTAGQYAYATLLKVSTDTWDLFGDLA